MWTLLESPIGTLRVVGKDAKITAIDFAPHHPTSGRPVGDRADDDPLMVRAREQLTAYFAKGLREFDLPLNPDGTEFQQRVWAYLRRIPYGVTVSYGQVARGIGLTPAASRAVGLANGRNPIPIVIPCHRVIGADGSLTGYAGGVERKQRLLDLEQDALF